MFTESLERIRAVDAAEEGLRVWAVPTSSTRTLLVWPETSPDKAVFVKTSLHSPLFGDRRIPLRKLGTSVGLSRLVEQSSDGLPLGINCFFEKVGFVPRLMPDSGIILRSIPPELRGEDIVACPLFALMGGSASHQPLLLTMVQRFGLQVVESVADILCSRFASIWLDLWTRFGFILEAHAQDLLLSLSRDLLPLGGFFYRDFEGLAVDWELRRARSLVEPVEMPHSWCWHDTYATWGYPTYQMTSCKLRTSLFDYTYFVLTDLNASLIKWQREGLIGGRNVKEGHMTTMFSYYLRSAIEDRFGLKEDGRYDIYTSLNRFVMFLLRVRREALCSV
jgi:hypothetical protein